MGSGRKLGVGVVSLINAENDTYWYLLKVLLVVRLFYIRFRHIPRAQHVNCTRRLYNKPNSPIRKEAVIRH